MGDFEHGWRWGELAGLVVLGLLLMLLWQVPMLGWVVYPFRLFGTFVHELSHGLAALATGGQFVRFSVEPDLSGLAWSAGGIRWVVASAGYIGSAVFGGFIVLLAARGVPTRWILSGLGVLLALLCLLYVRNLFGIATGLAMAGALLVAGLYLRGALADMLVMVLALQALLDGFNSLFNVWRLSGASDVHTDAHIMAQLSGLPAGLWVVIWMSFSLLVLAFVLHLAFHGPRRSQAKEFGR